MTTSADVRHLVVFDFDWTLVDQDTDHYVLEVLAPNLRRKMENLMPSEEWTDNVANRLVELHESGITKDEIQDCLRAIPFHPAMLRTVRFLKSAQCKNTSLFCLSSSNTVYINTILEHHGLESRFDELVTNPAEWDSSGSLLLRRRIDPGGPQHACLKGCGPNMCKGEELNSFLKRSHNNLGSIVYVGDGGNDFCPVVSLRSQDYAIVRRGFGLEKRIQMEDRIQNIHCQVVYWTGAWEVEEFFKEKFIRKSVASSSHL